MGERSATWCGLEPRHSVLVVETIAPCGVGHMTWAVLPSREQGAIDLDDMSRPF